MCLRPVKMIVPQPGRAPSEGVTMTMAKNCGMCWQCEKQYLNDYTGRCLCENVYSDHSAFVTLTYAPSKGRELRNGGDGHRDDMADTIINKKHFQNFLKAIRKRGCKVRYLVTAEFGERKGRVHFHAILFFQGKPLDIQDTGERGRVHHVVWPHGHMNWRWGVDERRIRYVTKYILKARKRTASGLEQGWKSQSKVPALGARWFAEKAAQMVADKVYPWTFTYQPPGGDPRNKYYITGATRRDYIRAIRDGMGDGPHDNPENLNEWVAAAYARDDREYDRKQEKLLTADQLNEEIGRKLDENRPDQKQIDRNSIDTDKSLPESWLRRYEGWFDGEEEKEQAFRRQVEHERRVFDARHEYFLAAQSRTGRTDSFAFAERSAQALEPGKPRDGFGARGSDMGHGRDAPPETREACRSGHGESG